MYLVILDLKTKKTTVQKVSNLLLESDEDEKKCSSDFDAEAYVSANYDTSDVVWGISEKIEVEI